MLALLQLLYYAALVQAPVTVKGLRYNPLFAECKVKHAGLPLFHAFHPDFLFLIRLRGIDDFGIYAWAYRFSAVPENRIKIHELPNET